MFLELLMTSKPPRRVPEEAAAIPADIASAIKVLTPADWARLNRYATYRIRTIGPKAEGRTGDDLLQTALVDLLEGTRRWNKDKVGFVKFLIWAMKSISSNWARGYKEEETLAYVLDVKKDSQEGETIGPLDHIADVGPDSRQLVLNEEVRQSDRELLEAIDQLFKDDEKARMVIEAWEEGYDPPVVRELWRLSQKDYDTIVRRIRRRVDRAGLTFGGREDVRQEK